MEEEEWMPEVAQRFGVDNILWQEHIAPAQAVGWVQHGPQWVVDEADKIEAVVEEYISLEQRAFERGMKEGFKLGLSYNKELVI